MGQPIRKLLALQEVDLQITALDEQKANLLDSIEKKRSEFEAVRAQFEEREQQLKQLKIDMKNMEVELAGTSERVRKLESQQINVKTNQEYKALDKEIYEAKAHKAQVEDQLLQKLELQEDGASEKQEASQELDRRSKALEDEAAGIQGKIDDIERKALAFQKRRSEVAATIEDQLLRLYERIFNSKKGPVLVPLVNRACQGCHLAVPAGVESILRRREADIIRCENCARILYIPKDEDE